MQLQSNVTAIWHI